MTKRNSKGQFAKATPVEPKKRPIEDWLGELPEPYRAQALEARKGWPSRSTKATSLSNAIMNGFLWARTPQNDKYWSNVYWWVKDPTNNALPAPWSPPAKDAPEGAQDYRDALITEYHLSVGKITKSIAEMSDKLDQIQRDIDLLKSGSSFMQELDRVKEQPKEEPWEPWEPKEGDHVRFKSEIGLTRQGHGILMEIHEEQGGRTAGVVSFNGYGSGTWWVDDLRPATLAEIERHQAELKAKEEEKKRKKLVRGCRVGTPDGDGIYLGDDGDGDGCEPHRVSLDLDGPGVVSAYNLDQITPLP